MAFITPVLSTTSFAGTSLSKSSLRPRRATAPAPRRAAIRAVAPKEVSDTELEEILQAQPGPLLSVFSAKWCGPCQFLVPQLQELSELMGERITIVKTDTDEYPEYSSAIGVRGLPSLYFIQDGKLKYKMEGADTAERLQTIAEHYFYDGPKPTVPEMPTV